MNETRTSYQGHIIVTRSWEEEPTALRHRRFTASFSVAHVASGHVGPETYLECIFVDLELAAEHALTLAKREIDEGRRREAA